MNSSIKIPVEVSARHIHLSQVDADILFGSNYAFRVLRELSQHGQFVAEEKLVVKTSKGTLSVRVLGPSRSHTQIELSATDARSLGLRVPLQSSGSFDGAPDILAIGPNGEHLLKECVILQQRHIHLTPKEAGDLQLRDRQEVSAQIDGPRGLRFDHVLIRIHPTFRMTMHVDTDEGNAAGIISGKTQAWILPQTTTLKRR